MAASSLALQLQVIQSLAKTESEPQKRPFTRPSILYNPKEAADINLDALLDIALSGLQVLIGTDERFRTYQNDLFSHKSKDLDRELMNIEDNKKIDASITSYLRLLSEHFQLPSALKTLEYLIRRYKIHVYNTEELILCALPYHDTHIFVRIVQLLNTGNTKWKFLDGVKVSGAPPPRNVIVQQCIRDLGVLEALCNYASSTKKFKPSGRTICFCTVVAVETLGSITTLDSHVIERVLPCLLSGLQLNDRVSSEHKAGALIIVGLLASRVALSPKLVKSLMRSIAEVARDDAKHSIDLQSFRTSFVALINLVQLQSVVLFPKKAVDILNEIRDIPEILAGLAKEFNLDKFLAAFIESLLEYGSSDGLCQSTMLAIVETVPLKHFVNRVVSKILHSCIRLSHKKNKSVLSESGIWAKGILESLNKSYPSEFLGAVHKFLEDAKVQSEKDGSLHETLCRILDGTSDLSLEVTDSQVWFLLEHPKAEVRRSALSRLNAFGALHENIFSSKSRNTFHDAILRRLHDDDLAVVQAVLTLTKLEDIINHHALIDALESVLRRCLGLLTSKDSSLPCDVATLCVELALRNFCGQKEFAEQLATMTFPLLLISPKAQRLSLKSIELAKELSWPFFQSLSTSSIPEKFLEHEHISAYNMDTITGLAETLVQQPEEYVPWLVKCCKLSAMSEVFLLLIVLQSFTTNIDLSQFIALYDACYPVLKLKWTELKPAGNISIKEANTIIVDGDCKGFLDQFLQMNFKTSTLQMKTNILVCIFWRLLQEFILLTKDASLAGDAMLCRIQDLFVFFAEYQSKHVFQKHLRVLLTECTTSPVKLLSKLFTEEGVSIDVQIESLQSFVMLCSQSDENLHFELLAIFPSLLIPLASDNQDIRMAAMNCIEGLRLLWRVNSSKWKNGRTMSWSHFVEGFLTTMVQQKRLIISDRQVLPAFITSLLSSSCHSLLVSEKIDPSFNQSTKTELLLFIIDSALKLPGYGKLVILSLLKGLRGELMRVKDIESLLCGLLERRHQYHLRPQTSCHRLTNMETELLCLLLESCAVPPSLGEHVFDDQLLEALWLGETSSEDPALVEPCVTVLRNLSTPLYTVLETEKQEQIFQHLVYLFRSANAYVQNAAREALLRLNFTCTAVVQMLDFIFDHRGGVTGTAKGKKKKKQVTHLTEISQTLCKNALPFLNSLLDILLLKKDMEDRIFLVVPLFKLLRKLLDDDWVNGDVDDSEGNMQLGVSQMKSSIYYIQQTLISVLEDISSSLLVHVPLKDNIDSAFDLKLLVEFARRANDGSIRNQVFSLLSTIAKLTPDKVLDHITDICNVIGESAVTQWDSHSQRVFELLLSAIVPCWLSKNDSANALLQIFVNILPEVSEHRRLSMMLHLLRNLGETDSLGSLLVLLFRSLISRTRLSFPDASIHSWDDLTSLIRGEWEFIFAMQICEHCSCMMWLPSFVKLHQQIEVGKCGEEFVMELLVAMLFTSDKLQDPDIAFKLASGEDNIEIQRTLGALLEQVIFHLQFVDSRRKNINLPSVVRKDLKEYMRTVPKIITKSLMPAAFFDAMVMLLRQADKSVQRKALGLISETVKDFCTVKLNNERRGSASKSSFWLQLDEGSMDSLGLMCSEIVKLVDGCIDDADTTLKVAAVSSLEVLAQKFSSNLSIFGACLTSVAKNIQSDNLAVSSCCLRAVGALINVLGPRALSELPSIMKNLLQRSDVKSWSVEAAVADNTALSSTESKESICMSILGALEAVIDKLSGFLNPYLGDVLKLLVLHPKYNTGSNPKLLLKAEVVRKLITEKIPVRLLLPPLLAIYSEAIKSGDSSVSITFDMLRNSVQTMDRSSVAIHHAKIFELCLVALDLRRQRPSSIKSVDVVERNVINTMVSLTMKLTESMFKPLFLRCIDWAESSVDGSGSTSIDRAISFYSFVNKLTEIHRSLFVPYFKYLLDSCVRHLAGAEDAKIDPPRKKKSKLLEASHYTSQGSCLLTVGIWHLRQLVLSSLHKCFLYDTGNLKFLDSSNFQALLKPVISQLVAEPPASVEELGTVVPTVGEVDDLLVACLGQMAVTAGTDLLWKPLNHEVLMQTRSENIRTRVLALRVVKYLVENLKEEYLVLLAETIPFLGELLEDVEPSVKSLAQEILKEMESMSGESLRQYL